MVRGIGARRAPLQDASGVGRSRAAALGFMCACGGIWGLVAWALLEKGEFWVSTHLLYATYNNE